MIFKLIGITLLLSAFLYISFDLTLFYKRKTDITEGLLLLLRHMRTRISCFSTPKNEIFGEFENAALEKCGFLSLAREHGLEKAAQQMRKGGIIPQKHEKILIGLWGQLGRGHRDNAVGVCDFYISELETVLAAEKNEHPRSARLARGILLTGGVMIIIVLI